LRGQASKNCLTILLVTAVSGLAACADPAQQLIREDIEWTRVWVPAVNQTNRPRVLLIGDSITEAYSSVVEKQLEEKAYVARLATSKSLGDPAFLQEVALVLDNAFFQVIHFNNGMHGVGYTEAEYRRDFPKLLAALKAGAPRAKLICATTTPKRVGHHLDQFDSFTDRIKARNKIAREFSGADKIPLDDLFALVESHREFYSDDGTHFNESGAQAEGRQVAQTILAALNEKSPDTTPFFAMDTALRDGKTRSPTDQARLLKELGFDGLGTSGYPSEEFLAAFETQRLVVYNTYLTLDFDSARPALDQKLREFVPRLKGHHTDLWIAINGVILDGRKLKPSAQDGDGVIVPLMRELADLAQSCGVRVAFYPHTGFWLERVEDAVRVARAVDRPNVGATFNLCHWLKVEGDRNPRPVLEEALPRLFFVTINGTETGDTRMMNWDKLIQPLEAGSYDVAGLLKSLHELGYRGPIGFQGYGIPGDSRDILSRTMEAWRRMNKP
jgi:sugar phosphate isomerase/epimerase